MANNDDTRTAVDEGNDRATTEFSSCGTEVGEGRAMAEVVVGEDGGTMVEV